MLVPFLSAVGLLLVMEGIVPFLSPARFRRFLAGMQQADDRVLRIAGFLSMVGGVTLLLLVRG